MAKKNKEIKVKYITLTDFANEVGRGLSHIAKLTKEVPVTIVPATQDGHACSAISLADKELILKKFPSLETSPLVKGEVDLPTLAKERGQDISGLRKFLIAKGYTLLKRVRPEGGGPVNAISEKEYKKLCTEHPKRVEL